MPTHDVKISSLRGTTITVTISRGLRLRVWIAVRLIRLTAWICDMDIRVHQEDDHANG